MIDVRVYSTVLVLVGAVFLLVSILLAHRTRTEIPYELRNKWLIIISLMYFFFAGYIIFLVLLNRLVEFPLELITGSVFFGGALFVFLVISLNRNTIRRIKETEVIERERDKAQNYLDVAGAIFLVLDEFGNVVRINKKGCEILGYTEGDIVGRSWFDNFIPEEKRDEIQRVFNKIMSEDHTSEYFENSVVTKSGSERIIAWHNSLLRDKEGEIVGTLSSGEDVTDRREAEERLNLSRQTMQVILDSMPYGVLVIGMDKRIISANNAVLALMGYDSEDEIVGKVCNDSLCPAEEGRCPIIDLNEPVDRSERVLLRKDGHKISVLKTVVPVELDNRPVLLEAVIDITEKKKADEQIRFLAYYDSLTGLPNRFFFVELLGRAIDKARRYEKMMAILFIDLDFFKRINETLGHSIGNQLLNSVTERLFHTVRRSDSVGRFDPQAEGDIISRFGGDEFVVLLHELTKARDAGKIAQRVLRKMSRPFILDNREVVITCSIGISVFPADGDDAEILLKNADIAMDHAKIQGRNNFQFYSHELNKSTLERLTLENELRKALGRKEFLLDFQPKLDIRTRKIIGIEALVRWKHPERGMVSPADFIPLAEETGLIIPLGEWVVREALIQNKEWQDAGIEPVRVAVNLSSRQFEQKNLLTMVDRH